MITAENIKELIHSDYLQDQPELKQKMIDSFDKINQCTRTCCEMLGLNEDQFSVVNGYYIKEVTNEVALNMQQNLEKLVSDDEVMKGLLNSDNPALIKEGMSRLVHSSIKDLIPDVMSESAKFIYVTSDRTVSLEEIEENMDYFTKILFDNPKLLDVLIDQVIEKNSEDMEQLLSENE